MLWALAAAAIPAIINMVRGGKEKKEGEALAAGNKRPVLDATGDYNDMLQYYVKQAQYGLDPSSMAWQLDQGNRGFTASLNAMLQGGGDPTNVNSLYSTYADTIARITGMDNELRWNKVNSVAGAMQQLINEKQTEFLYNKDAPYKDIAQLASAKQQAGFATTSSALDTLSSAAMSAVANNYKPDAAPQDHSKPYPVTDNSIVKTTTPIPPQLDMPRHIIGNPTAPLAGTWTIPTWQSMVGPQPYNLN